MSDKSDPPVTVTRAPAPEPRPAPQPKPAQAQPEGEIAGPKGPEPTRYGDWEKNGRCSDF